MREILLGDHEVKSQKNHKVMRLFLKRYIGVPRRKNLKIQNFDGKVFLKENDVSHVDAYIYIYKTLMARFSL